MTSRSETVATVTGAHIYKCFQSASEKQNTSRKDVTCVIVRGCGEGFENAPL